MYSLLFILHPALPREKKNLNKRIIVCDVATVIAVELFFNHFRWLVSIAIYSNVELRQYSVKTCALT